MKHILASIKIARIANGYSLRAFSKQINMSHVGYKHIEDGINQLSIEKLIEICTVLQLDIRNLLENTTHPHSDIDIIKSKIDLILEKHSVLETQLKSIIIKSDDSQTT